MRHILLTLGLGIVSSPAAQAARDDYPKNPGIDIVHYAFQIALEDESDELECEARIDVRFLAAGIRELRLDLIGVSQERPERGMRVTSVTSSTASVTFRHEGDALLIALAEPSVAGQHQSFTIHYRGVPHAGLVIGPNKHGDRSFFTDNWPNKARHWLPTIDHPYDKATCEFSVTAPEHYLVVSNGLKIEETALPGGRRMTHWKQSVPIATWLYVIGVAPFAVQYVDEYQGRSIQTWVYRQDREAGFHDFAVPTKQVLEFFGEHIGPFSYEKLANVQASSIGGGMEAASAIFYGEDSVTGRRSERWRNVVIHELAHQWFGNAVTEYDWDDVWLSEGFATYFTLLFIEHAYGRDAFLSGLDKSRSRVLRFNRENPGYRVVHSNLTDMRQVTTSQTYQKGSWTLHMLRGVVGDEAFWRGIRAYYREHRDGNATTADFRRAMEQASGADLEQFFDQWLYRGSALKLAGGWRYDPSSKLIEIDLHQVQQDGSAFRMPIEVAIEFGSESVSETQRLLLDQTRKTFQIPAERRPQRLVLDPNTWVLMESDFRELEYR